MPLLPDAIMLDWEEGGLDAQGSSVEAGFFRGQQRLAPCANSEELPMSRYRKYPGERGRRLAMSKNAEARRRAAKIRRPIIKGEPRWADGLCVECGAEFRCLRAVKVEFRRCIPCRKPPPDVETVIERLAKRPRF